jgi:hypothetical protein
VEKRGFDTAASSSESELLEQYLDAVAVGQIVLVVSYGDAWSDLTPEAMAALQRFGIQVTYEEMQGKYLAAAGVQGAADGSGVWSLHESEAFLAISLNRDRRALSAAVDWVNVEPLR